MSPPDAIPIVYSEGYDIRFMGLEKLHPFDSAKYGKVHRHLTDEVGLDAARMHVPGEVTEEQLRLVHTEAYLKSLDDSEVVARIAELGLLASLPNSLVQCRLLRPMRLATGGTILAAELALERGWAINLSGGYHHAKPDGGEGFCVYADIPIAAQVLWRDRPDLAVMVLDLDAHQGNGIEMCFRDDERVTIVDFYNREVYPGDAEAIAFADIDVPFESGAGGAEYLAKLREILPAALDANPPGLLFYNAGTDVYETDPLGQLSLSRGDILERDEWVFRQARERGVPIVMVLSGGYTQESAGIIGASLRRLFERGLLE